MHAQPNLSHHIPLLLQCQFVENDHICFMSKLSKLTSDYAKGRA